MNKKDLALILAIIKSLKSKGRKESELEREVEKQLNLVS